jgi:hypothetical protein
MSYNYGIKLPMAKEIIMNARKLDLSILEMEEQLGNAGINDSKLENKARRNGNNKHGRGRSRTIKRIA